MALGNLLRKVYHRLVQVDPLQQHIDRGLVVGRNFNMLEEVIIDYSHSWHIKIGDDVTFAPRVHVLAHDASTKMHLNYTRLGKVSIGNRVFVGASTTILPGVTIGDDVVIGAGSVVSKDVGSGQVVAGNPAKVICTTEEYLARRREEMEKSPKFGEEYTLSEGVTPEMKQAMNDSMKDRIGYII